MTEKEKEQYRTRIQILLEDWIMPLLLAALLCLLIGLLAGCHSYKAFETDEHRSDSIIVSASSTQSTAASSTSSATTTTLSEIMRQTDAWWRAHIVRTHYATDSVGNRYIAMEEVADLDGERKDTVYNVTNSQLTITTHDTITISRIDTLYISANTEQRKHEEKTSTPHSPSPLTSLYIIPILLALLYLMWIGIKNRIRNYQARRT